MRFLSVRIHVKTKTPEKTLSMLIRTGISFSKPCRNYDGFYFTCSVFAKKRALSWAMECGLEPSFCYEGIFAPLLALKSRPGIIFGTFFTLFLIYLSTFYVWSVKIIGNESMDESEIIRLLSECGFREGVRKSSIDVNEIQNTALARCHELSFLSINIHGLTADVVVHERVTAKKALDPDVPYNLVADCDGVIVSSLILNGQTLFQTGDTVYKGQLLVSGLAENALGGISTRHAIGKVYARTHRTLSFEVPFESVQKIYTFSELSHGIRILGHSISAKPSGDTGDYDLEYSERELSVFGLSVPITLETRRAKHYTIDTSEIDSDTAYSIALDEYRRYISTELDCANITDEKFDVTEDENSLVLTVEVTAIENIAVEKKINITEG